jgi:ABC-2 type transport system ATP-binding protein
MIKTGETVTLEVLALPEEHIEKLKELPHVYQVIYEHQILKVSCSGGKHNLMRILNYLNTAEVHFGRVYSELPTLNDVFLEITGKELRD